MPGGPPLRVSRAEPDTRPLVVVDAAGTVRALARMDAKAFGKSVESGELWERTATGRVLPLAATGGQAVPVRDAGGWYEARLPGGRSEPAAARRVVAPGELAHLERLLRARRRTLPEGSYTAYLFQAGIDKIRKKLGEEAIEVITARTAAEVAAEAADLLYHLLVLLVAEEVPLDRVLEILAARGAGGTAGGGCASA